MGVKISALTLKAVLSGTEEFEINDGGVTKKTTASAFTGINEVGFTDLGTGSGTLDLNFGNQWIMFFRGQTSFSTAKNVSLSFDSNAYKFDFSFTIGSISATLTFPSNFIGDTSDTRWDTSLHKWTSDATGKFRVTGTFDGIDWFVEFTKAPYA
jgi:hypothetical protein